MTTASAPSASRGGALDSRPSGRGIDWFLLAAILGVLAVTARVLLFTPMELRQGLAQKIFYIHVPAAILALYFAVLPSSVVSGLYLWLKDPRLDRIAESLAEVGVMFCTVVLCTGPFWGKPIWGTYWQWEARLTSTLFLWFVLIGYLVLRGAIEQPESKARLSAVVAVMAGFLVPFIHLTVYMFNTLHPMPVVLTPNPMEQNLSPEMRQSFLWSMLAFFVFYCALVRNRYAYATARDIQQLEDQA